jgi:ribosomal protein S18 acetylase RimI-like enzyme
MTTIQTRLATLADLDAVAPLFDAYRQFYGRAPDPALAAGFIGERLRNHESVILLAEDAGQRCLGFCQLYPSFCSVAAAPIYVLYDLFVLPDARRTGAGTALLQAAERHAAQHGFARLELTTARTNTTAQALYQAMGWTRDEVFVAYNKRVQD